MYMYTVKTKVKALLGERERRNKCLGTIYINNYTIIIR